MDRTHWLACSLIGATVLFGGCQQPEPSESEPLSTEEREALLEQLPPLEQSSSSAPTETPASEASDAPSPPEPGETPTTAFPPPEPAQAADGETAGEALRIERFAPQGDIDRARLISLTFSQPMVDIGAHAEQPTPPITVEPAVDGQWRWLDTYSLVFEPNTDALPMATEYTVTVDDSLRSLAGQSLNERHQWHFATSALEVTRYHPAADQPLAQQPVLVLIFNQPVEAETLIPRLQIRSANGDDQADGQTWPVEQAPPSLIERDLYQAGDVIEGLAENHWVAVTPSEPLPKDHTFTLTLPAGTTVTNGNRATREAQHHTLRTAGPLAMEPSQCTERSPCSPEAGFRISLNNPLSDDWSKDQLTVSPDVPELAVSVYGNRLYLSGDFEPETRYTVTLKAGTTDQFEQVLQQDLSVEQFTRTFNPMLQLPGGRVVTLPAHLRHELPVYSRNVQHLDVELRRVTPEDWSAFQQFERQPRDTTAAASPPGEVAARFRLELDDQGRAVTTTGIPLDEALDDRGLGHVIVTLRATELDQERHPTYSRSDRHVWVQVSNLGVSTYTDAQDIVSWATRLDNGQPVEGAELRINAERATTDADGIAVLDTSAVDDSESAALLSLGNDQLLLPELNRRRPWLYDSGAQFPTLTFTDRGLYQPGETVHLKGIIRQLTAGPEGDVVLPTSITHAQWHAYDGQSQEVAKGRVELNSMGAFDLSFAIPRSAASGMGHVELQLQRDGSDQKPQNVTRLYQGFQIEEYRRPEYEVVTTLAEDDDFYIAQTELNADVTATYYSGGALPNAPVQWQVSLNKTHFAPPGWSEYVFGQWRPIWYRSLWPMPEPEVWRKPFDGVTGSDGKHRLPLEPNDQLALDDLRYAHRLTAEATVTDVNRQQWSSRSEQLIHPASRYVGLRTENTLTKADNPITLHWVTVDIEGERASGTAPDLRIERMTWENDDWTVAETLTCEKGSENSCAFTPEQAGQYRLTASVSDEHQRISETQMTLWVAGENAPDFPSPANMEPAVQLIPDQESYEPGDTARLQIQAPFSGNGQQASALITVQQQGLKAYYPIVLDNGQYTLELPIGETDMPGLTIQVDAIQVDAAGNRQGSRLPQYATGMMRLPVSTESRALNVTLDTDKQTLKPGQTVTASLAVKDHEGHAFSAGQVTLYAVDDAVLGLTGYTAPAALDAFYRDRPLGVDTTHSRFGLLEPPQEEMMVSGSLAEKASARFAAGMAAPPSGNGGVTPRSDFNPLATFQSTVALNRNGEANVSFTLPDTLTRYRLIAVAYGEQQFGVGESELTVGLPLMVRPSLPRFLNLGDNAELPVVVQNTTDQPMTVKLALRAANLTITGEPGRRLMIPANDRREIRFTAEPIETGTATVQVIVQSGQHQDAAEISLPVERPATREAFAQYGSLTEGNAFLGMAVPDNVYRDFGGLSLTTSSSQLQSLSDAFLYLLDYPYGGSEQLASRLMAITVLKDLLGEFHAEGLPEPQAIENSVSDILARLQELQNSDGGWGFWSRDGRSYPWVSVHVTHALLRAREAGYAIEPSVLDAALAYNRDITQHLPDTLGAKTENSTHAYSLYVRSLNGTPVAEQAVTLFENADEDAVSLEAMGWLLSAVGNTDSARGMRQEIHRRLNNQLRETAATAQFVDDYPQNGHWILYGSRRTDAVVLDALLTHDTDTNQVEKSDLPEKLARGLLNDRRNGRWGNTQENVFALLALKRYFLARESEVPDLTLRAWLGDTYLGDATFQGRQTEPHTTQVAMNTLQTMTESQSSDRTSTLTLQHQGSGRVYYRVGLQYAPADLQLDSASHGFRVTRQYEPINDPDDVKRAEDGTWEIRAGAAVNVKLTLTVPARRYHVALTDYLPAGFEALNPALQTTATARPPEISRGSLIRRPAPWPQHWYEHQQLRNERTDAFSTEVEAGVYEYEYTALATTPGTFISPPAIAEELYQPETFGRTATNVVRIRARP